MTQLIIIIGSFLFNLTIVATDPEKLEKPGDDTEPSQLELILAKSVEDDPLHPEVAAFLDDWPEPVWDNNAFVYAWGMGMDEEDIYQTGLDIAKNLRTLNLNHDYKAEYDLSFLKPYDKTELPEKDYLCRMDLSGCFNQMVEDHASYLETNQAYFFTIERYKKFLSFENFSDTSFSLILDESPILSYRIITVGQELQYLKWIEIFNSKGVDEAVISSLQFENRMLRKRLEQSDSLIGKMILSAMYSKHIEFIHGIWSKGWISDSLIDETAVLQPLTQEQLDFSKAWANEERMALTMINRTFRPENAKAFLSELFYPGITNKMVKTNQILNKIYLDVVKPALSYQNLTAPDFYRALQEFDLIINFDQVANPAAAMLNQSTEQLKSKYMSFTIRVHELNMKIHMLKLIVQSGSIDNFLKTIEQGKSTFHNYYDGSQPKIVDGRLCFNRPFDHGYFSCLVIIN